MKIRHFLYNAFLVEDETIKIAIDPGQNLWLFNLHSLIPKKEWDSVTHVLVTHGDPDHYYQADRVAIAANAPLIMNASMVKQEGSETCILVPRRGKVEFESFSGEFSTLNVGETLEINGAKITAIKTQHGPIEYSILGFKRRRTPSPQERTGFGSIGFFIDVNGKTVLNLGDSLIQQEWTGLKPDVLMLPIGGFGNSIWTMDVTDALQAVRLIAPKLVIPCHYNVPFILKKKFAQADDQYFKREVEKMGIECRIMNSGDEIKI